MSNRGDMQRPLHGDFELGPDCKPIHRKGKSHPTKKDDDDFSPSVDGGTQKTESPSMPCPLDDFEKDMICTGCGKDPYKSSTGCLCGLDTPHEWVEGKGSYGGDGNSKFACKKTGVLKCPQCGANRHQALKDSGRVMPCSECKDEGRPLEEFVGKNK